jgi:bifunctional UDP-N-acetylglucosamine pyrophosphorylase/glucosamine-1-phosphate N-acetyltransferase/UDP-N-acetylglucosamine pyrophosphorylase
MTSPKSVMAIVLAAGKGTRMKSELPKVMCLANGRPLVQYVHDALRAAGINRIVNVVGYRAEEVQAAFAGQPGQEFALQAEQLGTGHAVMMCRQQLQSHSGPVVIVAGDSPMLQTKSIQRLLQEFTSGQPACVLGTLVHPDPTGLGRIIRDSAGNFLKIVEQRDASPAELAVREVNMSTYVFDAQALLSSLDQLTADNQQREYYITDLPAILLGRGADVRALPVLDPIEALSVNTVEQLAQVESALNGMKSK